MLPADESKAVDYLTQAAASGSAMAQHNLGWRFLLGEGVDANLVTAQRHFQAAAAGNWQPAVDALQQLDEVVTRIALQSSTYLPTIPPPD
eukprot:SAG31_NODE_12177_length_961_cov_1.003480_1_plen_90_part_00